MPHEVNNLGHDALLLVLLHIWRCAQFFAANKFKKEAARDDANGTGASSSDESADRGPRSQHSSSWWWMLITVSSTSRSDGMAGSPSSPRSSPSRSESSRYRHAA